MINYEAIVFYSLWVLFHGLPVCTRRLPDCELASRADD